MQPLTRSNSVVLHYAETWAFYSNTRENAVNPRWREVELEENRYREGLATLPRVSIHWRCPWYSGGLPWDIDTPGHRVPIL